MFKIIKMISFVFFVMTSFSSYAVECANIEEWKSGKIYYKSDRVKFNNFSYKAKWWSRNDNPKTNNEMEKYPVWDKLGECVGTPPPPPPPPPPNNAECANIENWQPKKIYYKGDKAKFDNFSYKAKWWTRGNNPKTNNEIKKYPVWGKLGSCETIPPGGDTTPPVISLTGANPVQVVQGGNYIEPGASAVDDRDGVVNVTIAGTVDTSTIGSYTITYTASDAANNRSTETRSVNVVSGQSNNLGQTDIRKTANNSNSIITLIKDDGFWATTPLFCDMLKRNNIDGKISEAFITGSVSASRWEEWKTLQATGCLDILNHTVTHPDLTLLSPAKLNAEIHDAQAKLEQVFSEKVITVVLPMAKRNDAVEAAVKKKHWSMKGGWQFNGYNTLSPTETEWYRLFQKQTTPTRTLAEMKQWLDDVVGKDKFLVMSTHSCGKGSPGWGNVPCEYWEAFFSYLATNFDSSDYWFTGAATATRYIRERQNATITILSSTNAQISLSLTDTLPDDVFNYPLLLRTVVPNDWQEVLVSQNNGAAKSVVTVMEVGVNYVYYNAIPDQGDIRLSSDTGPDTRAPEITFNGDNPMSVALGGNYIEPGATAMDARDGEVTVSIKGFVDTSRLGNSTITYTATDIAGNTATATRIVNVAAAIVVAKPFPQEKNYATLQKPNHKNQSQLNSELVKHYNRWKMSYLTQSNGGTPGSGYYIKMTGTGPGCEPRVTTSEAHGWGMLIMALMAGQESEAKTYFDGMYNMYDKHRSTINNHLMSWCISQNEDSALDSDSAADGDMDIAYSLLLAHEQWGSSGSINYLVEAKRIITLGIKAGEMGYDKRVMLGDWWNVSDPKYVRATRSSDWMTSHMRVFAKATNDNYWLQAIDTVYSLISSIQTSHSQNTGLMPDFVVGDKIAPEPAPANFLEADTDGQYSWNACRFPLRIALDAAHFNNANARTAMTDLTSWLQTATGGQPSAVKPGYTLAGKPLPNRNYTSMSFTAPMIAAATVAEGNHQDFINKGWDLMDKNSNKGYYSDSINLLSMLFISGNWWEPME